MSETAFTTILDDYDPGEDWPEGRHTLETAIEGELADRVRARVGKPGPVVVREEGAEGGYSEFTVEWDWEFTVMVGGEAVWQCDGYSPAAFDGSRGGSFGRFLRWVDGS